MVTTDADGKFRTPRMPVGEIVVAVDVPQRQHAYQSIQSRPDGELTLPKPIELAQDVPLAGTVRDSLGNPLAGVAIAANSAHTAASDTEGNFTLHGFDANPRFQLQMSKAGYVFINWGVKVDQDGVTHAEVQNDNAPPVKTRQLEVVMEPVAWIEGHAVDADTGEAVKLDKVILCTFERKPDGEIVVGGCRVSDFEQPSPGVFRVPYSRPDEYHLAVKAEGYQDGEAFTPLVNELQPISGLIVKLKSKRLDSKPQVQQQQLAGTVTRDGKPIKSGWVGLWSVRHPNDIVNAYIMRRAHRER